MLYSDYIAKCLEYGEEPDVDYFVKLKRMELAREILEQDKQGRDWRDIVERELNEQKSSKKG